MKPLLLLWLVCFATSALLSQTQPSGSASTTGKCSVANTGNQNTVTITCGIGKKQGQEMLGILNKILANQLDPKVVMDKLNQIEKEVATQNEPLKRVYVCRGLYRLVGSAPLSALYISDFKGQDNVQIFNAMAHANNAKDWGKLLNLCSVQKTSKPEWPSPYLFCALAELGLGNAARAREMMDHYEARLAGVPDDQPCSTMAEYIHTELATNPSTSSQP
jgi:hypothetical protein